MRAKALPALVAVAIVGGASSASAQTVGAPLNSQEIGALAAPFADNPLNGDRKSVV